MHLSKSFQISFFSHPTSFLIMWVNTTSWGFLLKMIYSNANLNFKFIWNWSISKRKEWKHQKHQIFGSWRSNGSSQPWALRYFVFILCCIWWHFYGWRGWGLKQTQYGFGLMVPLDVSLTLTTSHICLRFCATLSCLARTTLVVQWGAQGLDRTAMCCYSVIMLVKGCIPFLKLQIRWMRVLD